MAADEPPTEHIAGADLLESVEFQHLNQAFKQASGLDLHAYQVEPGTVPRTFEPPQFCRSLQAGQDCPLYFDPSYRIASGPEIRAVCAGVGHVVIPVFDGHGGQLLNLVSDSARFGPVDIDQGIEKAFALKVVPDELLADAEAVPLVDRERALFAAQALSAGLGELAAGRPRRASALEMLVSRVAAVPTSETPRAILDAALEFTGAEFAYITMVDADGSGAVDGSSLESRGEWWRILAGMAQWVLHAESPVETADVSESAWCRHLAGTAPPPAGLYGVPLAHEGGVYGSIVVGGADMTALGEWRDALRQFVDATADAMVLCRRLLAIADGGVVDPSGAYSLRYIEELLEKEISRAGRHNHQLSVVVFHLENFAELVAMLGPAGAEEVLAQLVDVIRSNTRKVNSIARVGDSAFVLVIPEADDAVADRIAEELRVIAQQTDYGSGTARKKKPVTLDLKTRTLTNPSGVLSALDHLSSPN